jgi:diacylglycerol kinase family enzyme
MTKLPRQARKFFKEYAPRKEIPGQNQDNRQCLLVVSSYSGNGNAARLAPKVAKYLARAFSKVVMIPTQHQGHCREIFKAEPLPDFDVAVVLGGDGAFSEAVNGMYSRTDGATVPLAHAPGGSGCGVSGNTLGVWKGSDIEKSCQLISQGKVGKMDVNQITCADGNVRYSLCCVSGGSHTDICEEADHFKWTYRWCGPTFRYIPGTVQAYRKYGEQDSNRPVRVTINDGEEILELSCFAMAIYNIGEIQENVSYVNQTMNSGTLGLQISKHYAGSLLKQLNYIGAVAQGKDLDEDLQEIHFEKEITSIKVEPIEELTPKGTRPFRIFLDGEKISEGGSNAGYAPFTSRVLPSKLDVIIA